ncbi:hypothetical protein [Bradyrhizobium sp.]
MNKPLSQWSSGTFLGTAKADHLADTNLSCILLAVFGYFAMLLA